MNDVSEIHSNLTYILCIDIVNVITVLSPNQQINRCQSEDGSWKFLSPTVLLYLFIALKIIFFTPMYTGYCTQTADNISFWPQINVRFTRVVWPVDILLCVIHYIEYRQPETDGGRENWYKFAHIYTQVSADVIRFRWRPFIRFHLLYVYYYIGRWDFGGTFKNESAFPRVVRFFLHFRNILYYNSVGIYCIQVLKHITATDMSEVKWMMTISLWIWCTPRVYSPKTVNLFKSEFLLRLCTWWNWI